MHPLKQWPELTFGSLVGTGILTNVLRIQTMEKKKRLFPPPARDTPNLLAGN